MSNKEINQKRFENFEELLLIPYDDGLIDLSSDARNFSAFLGNSFIFDENDIKVIDQESGHYFDQPVKPLFEMVANRVKETGSPLSV